MSSLLALSAQMLGCSLVLDGSRHQGGDADGGGVDAGSVDAARSDGGADGATADGGGTDGGPDAGCLDEDNDGHLATSCGGDDCDDTNANVYPGAPPICGDATSQRCPGDPPVPAGGLGAGLTIAGLLPLLDLVEPGPPLQPGLGMAATPIGHLGYGTMVVAGQVVDGLETRLARRDVPLDDPRSFTSEPFMTSSLGTPVDVIPATDSLGIDLERLDDDRIGVGIVGRTSRAGQLGWRGVLDFVGGTSAIYQQYTDAATPVWGEPAIGGGLYMFWREGSGVEPAINGYTIFDDPPAFALITNGVPTGQARMTADRHSHGMIEPATGGRCFFSFGEDVVCGTGPVGVPAAFGEVDDVHLLASANGGIISMLLMDCTAGCGPAPRVTPVPEINTGTGRAAVFDLAPLSTGNQLMLYSATYPDGDVLYVQPILPIGGVVAGAAGERIEVLSLRGENRQVLDAEVDVVDAASGTSVVIAATIGDTFATMADRLVFTGVRACTAD